MQQINLYTDALKPKRDPLPITLFAAVVVCIGLALTGVTAWQTHQLTGLNAKSTLKLGQKVALENQVNALSEKVAAMRRDESLVALNERLRERVAIRKELLKTLGGVVSVNPYKFSELMLGLARQHSQDLWLTQFEFSAGGQQLQFAGRALSPEVVPAYLQKLRSETSFGGRTFQLFALEETSESTRQGLMFNIASIDTGKAVGLLNVDQRRLSGGKP